MLQRPPTRIELRPEDKEEVRNAYGRGNADDALPPRMATHRPHAVQLEQQKKKQRAIALNQSSQQPPVRLLCLVNTSLDVPPDRSNRQPRAQRLESHSRCRKYAT